MKAISGLANSAGRKRRGCGGEGLFVELPLHAVSQAASSGALWTQVQWRLDATWLGRGRNGARHSHVASKRDWKPSAAKSSEQKLSLTPQWPGSPIATRA